MRFKVLPSGGTCVCDAVKIHMPFPHFIRGAALKYVIITRHHYDRAVSWAAELANEGFAKTKGK